MRGVMRQHTEPKLPSADDDYPEENREWIGPDGDDDPRTQDDRPAVNDRPPGLPRIHCTQPCNFFRGEEVT